MTPISLGSLAPHAWNMHHGEPPGPLVYIGRSRKWGGPSPLANRWCPLGMATATAIPHEDPLGMYRAWIWRQLVERNGTVLAALDSIREGGFVGCTCAPRPCHADIVIGAWQARRSQVPVDRLLEAHGWRLPADTNALALVHEAIKVLGINGVLDWLRSELNGKHSSYALEPIGRELGERWECPAQLVALEERRAA